MLSALTLCLAAGSAYAQVQGPLLASDSLLDAVASSSSVTAGADLPDAPSVSPDAIVASQTAASSRAPDATTGQPKQTKRILGIVPNFRSVSADVHLPPESPREKFTTAFQDSFDYSSAIFIAAQAALYYGFNQTPQFHDGWPGYARYYWHTYADTADENFWVEAILPSVLHQDSRFYTLGHGSTFKRAEYALTRVVITRNDKGNEVFNASEIVGAGAASGISSLYYPGSDRNLSKVGQIWYTNILIDGGTFVFKEFWPDINNKLFHTKD